MKKTILAVTVVAALIMLLSSCNTFVWDPTGTWVFTITGSWGATWTETMTFSGSDTTGTVTGWSYLNPSGTAGSWTRTDYTMIVSLDFQNGFWRNVVTLTCTSSESQPNSISGNGNWEEYWLGSPSGTYTLNFTATKTANLQ